MNPISLSYMPYYELSLNPENLNNLRVTTVFSTNITNKIVIENFKQKIIENKNNYNWFLEELKKGIELTKYEQKEQAEIEKLFKENIENYYLEYLQEVQKLIQNPELSKNPATKEFYEALEIAIDYSIKRLTTNLEDKNCDCEKAADNLEKIAKLQEQQEAKELDASGPEMDKTKKPVVKPMFKPEQVAQMSFTAQQNLAKASIIAMNRNTPKLTPISEKASDIDKDLVKYGNPSNSYIKMLSNFEHINPNGESFDFTSIREHLEPDSNFLRYLNYLKDDHTQTAISKRAVNNLGSIISNAMKPEPAIQHNKPK